MFLSITGSSIKASPGFMFASSEPKEVENVFPVSISS